MWDLALLLSTSISPFTNILLAASASTTVFFFYFLRTLYDVRQSAEMSQVDLLLSPLFSHFFYYFTFLGFIFTLLDQEPAELIKDFDINRLDDT